MASRDAEIKAVVDQLDDILARLKDNVDALAGILTSSAPAGAEADERLTEP